MVGLLGLDEVWRALLWLLLWLLSVQGCLLLSGMGWVLCWLLVMLLLCHVHRLPARLSRVLLLRVLLLLQLQIVHRRRGWHSHRPIIQNSLNLGLLLLLLLLLMVLLLLLLLNL